MFQEKITSAISIPIAEQSIPAVMAEPWFTLNDRQPGNLEGLCFDRHDNLYFVDIDNDILYRLKMETKELSVVFSAPGKKFASVKVHRDDRLFICSLDPAYGIFFVQPDGSGYHEIEVMRGHVVDDLVFDSKGGFYFTELEGECVEPTGGVFYVNAELNTVRPVIKNLAAPNGIALSTDEKVLWITETTGGRLLRFELDESGMRVKKYGSYPAYHFLGKPGPDSCTVDEEDNLYVALYRQGRYMVFQRDGWPIGQYLIPSREKGLNLVTTHCKIRPGTKELYMCAASGGAAPSGIFRAEAVAQASTHDFHLI